MITHHIRRSKIEDAQMFPAIERSAGLAFRAIPEFAWIADDDDLPVEFHQRLIARGTSWTAADDLSAATGRDDAASMGFVIRDEDGETIAVAAGHSWAGIAEIKQIWVDDKHRGLGYGRAVLDAMIAEARTRGLRRIWVSSYEFQAPLMYEKAGFVRSAEFSGWPDGHTLVILCKALDQVGFASSSQGPIRERAKHI